MDVNFEILLLKRRVSSSEQSILLRDGFGRTKEPLFNDDNGWVLLKHRPYYYEENFKVHGRKERFSLIDLISKVINPCLSANKKDGRDINLIVTKNKLDSIRLYDKIKELFMKKKKLNILFSGEVPRDKRSGLYTKLGSVLKISRDYLWRGMTR